MDESTLHATKQWTMALPIVSAYVASVVRDFRDRDDVLQETAVAVIQSYSKYDPSRPFVGWALGIARNQIGTYLRQRQRSRLVFDQETINNLGEAFETIQQEELDKLGYLRECIRGLEGRAKQLCELRYENDLKPAAIASLVGMTANTVAKSLQRLRDQLRRCIEQKARAESMLQ